MVRDKVRCQCQAVSPSSCTCAITMVSTSANAAENTAESTMDKLIGWICGAIPLLMAVFFLGQDVVQNVEQYFIVLLRVLIIVSPVVTVGVIALVEMSALPLWKKAVFIILGLVILFVTYRWSRQMTVEHLAETILRHRFLPRP